MYLYDSIKNREHTITWYVEHEERHKFLLLSLSYIFEQRWNTQYKDIQMSRAPAGTCQRHRYLLAHRIPLHKVLVPWILVYLRSNIEVHFSEPSKLPMNSQLQPLVQLQNWENLSRTLPMTLWAARALQRIAASPKSPILTSPWLPLIKMLSHLRSRWIIGGSWPCRYERPSNICLDQFLSALISTLLCFLRYLHEHTERVVHNPIFKKYGKWG